MTSGYTREITEHFFKENNYFGYSRDHVIFFEQFNIPVLSLKGKILMKNKSSICWSPGKKRSSFCHALPRLYISNEPLLFVIL